MTTNRAYSAGAGVFRPFCRFLRLKFAFWLLRTERRLHAVAQRIIEREEGQP
jgi:hypothetical protein